MNSNRFHNFYNHVQTQTGHQPRDNLRMRAQQSTAHLATRPKPIFCLELEFWPTFSNYLTPGTADRKPGAAFGTKGVTGLRIRCCHLLTLLPDLVTIIYVRGEVLGKNWPKIAGDFRKVNITFRLDVYCRYM